MIELRVIAAVENNLTVDVQMTGIRTLPAFLLS
jgi:hypothetical protein